MTKEHPDTRRLIIVSNRLPFNCHHEGSELRLTESTGGLVTGLGSFLDSVRTKFTPVSEYLWVGWPGATIEESQKESLIVKARSAYCSYPVFLSETEMENFYHGFCNKTIWPLFHYFSPFASYKEEFWKHYIKVNEIFCDQLISMIEPHDLVWIHDYHLMLLPKLLKARTPNIPIGYFLHIPFPSFEIFRLLPGEWRREILDGMLGADLIGFHTYDYTQHFLQCVLRILGYEHQLGMISLPNRTVRADTFPMGIDYRKYATALSKTEIQEEYNNLKKSLAGFKVVLSVDRLDYSKGILNRLHGFELFLDLNPQFHGKVVLVMIVVPSRIMVDQYEQSKKQIEELIGNINGKFSRVEWTPVIYQYKYYSFAPLTALYNISDVALVTPLRDGMNLVAKEYVASQRERRGVLILSEMTGSAYELGEAIIINPNNREEISAALKDALEMPEEEQIRRNQIMQNRLRRYDVLRWSTEFISQLSFAAANQVQHHVKLLDSLHQQQLAEAYRKSLRRIFLLDYDGTLTQITRRPDQAKPNEKIIKLLQTMSADKKNIIVIVSGRERKIMGRWFENLPIGFVSEHGTWVKEPEEDWKMLQEQSASWKSNILPILEQHADRLPGAFVEEKEYSLCWHYRSADPEQSQIVARELTDHLVNYTANINLQVLRGKKMIEIRTLGVDKGRAASYWISKYKPDFIFAVGDDITDEDLFKRLPEEAHTIRVGMVNTLAKYNLRDSQEVVRMLESLIKQV